MADYDTVVLGVGGVGSAALWQVAQRGARVLGIDRFAPPHDRGSSHGQSRIIRQAYFEHPDYTPLLVDAYRLWGELERHVGRKLYHQVGVLQIGPDDGAVVPGVLRAAEQHQLDVARLTAAQIESRWPSFRVPGQMLGVLESRAGYLLVEPCVQAHVDAAVASGAELRTGVEVHGWQPGDPIRVATSDGQVTTNKLIVTAGAWARDLLAQLPVPLEVRRKSLFWYATTGDDYLADSGCPGFFYELPYGVFYGFPQIDERGVKFAEHSGGQQVDDPLQVDRALNADDRRQIEAFVEQCLPKVSLRCTDHAVCMYTMTPDEHFVVDRHPDCPDVVFAAGLSGHGFKFTSVFGKALAELALDGGTDLPIEFLSLERLLG